MAKPKSKTIQQRFGFSDKDFKAPKHDEIMLWLDNAIDLYFDELTGFSRSWERNEFRVSNLDDSAISEEQEDLFYDTLDFPVKPPSKIIQKIWEYSIVSTSGGNKYIVGFADMRVLVGRPHVIYHIEKDKLLVRPTQERISVYFEVKTKLDTLGELIRQIRMYETYTKGEWFVVAPDPKYEKMLSKQDHLQFSCS